MIHGLTPFLAFSSPFLAQFWPAAFTSSNCINTVFAAAAFWLIAAGSDRRLPLLNADFSTRLKKRPDLILGFTQGQSATGIFKPYSEIVPQGK